jgi:ElaB/YqjD/DUF883 family membrane-anchored ribosome-binding protein
LQNGLGVEIARVGQPTTGKSNNEEVYSMLYTIAVVLLILWLLGLVTSYTLGGFIHILLVVAVVMVLVNLISGRRALWHIDQSPALDVSDTTTLNVNACEGERMGTDAEGDRITTDKLMADLRMLADDTEQLLKATASQTGQQVAQVRAKAEESLNAVKASASDLQDVALAKARATGRATHDYVRANPWQVLAVCAVAGFVLGSLLARGGAADP